MNGRVLKLKNKTMPIKERNNRCQYLRNWKSNNREKILLQQAHYRAKTKGISFDIEVSDIIIPEICPILGLPLKTLIDGNRDLSPSLDRMDNTKGYVKGNVQVISSKANTMKHNANQEDLINFANWVRKTYEQI
jgi:hypothetical protein